MQALLTEKSRDADRWRLVDQISVEHRGSETIGIDGLAKNRGGMQRGGSGEAVRHGVEIVDNTVIFGDIIVLIAVAQFDVAHLAVEVITAVAFVDDDTIKGVDGRFLAVIGAKKPGDHALHGGDIKAR